MKIKIAPSILNCDFGKLNEEIASIEKFVDILHLDVMDGNFVPNLSFGAPIIEKIKTNLPLDCHLMVDHPETYIEDFAKVNADIITIHEETCKNNLQDIIEQIKAKNIKVGVAINPDTSLEAVKEILGSVDMLLVMSVFPGFGGQSFMPEVLEKIKEARSLYPDLDIQIDGGINEETVKEAVYAGANIIVAGSFIFKAEDREKAIKKLKIEN